MAEVKMLGTNSKVWFIQLLNFSGHYPQLDNADFDEVDCYGVFDDDGIMVGGCMVLRRGIHAYLDYLYVTRAARQQGHATLLLENVHTALRRTGIRYVYASISGENEVSGKLAIKYRSKVGFPYMHVRADLKESTHG